MGLLAGGPTLLTGTVGPSAGPPVQQGEALTVGTVGPGATNFTVTLPSGITNGNLLSMMLYKVNGIVYDVPAGWIQNSVLEFIAPSGDARAFQMMYKFASSEPATVDVGSATEASARAASAIVVEYSGVHADVFDVTPVNAHVTHGQNNDQAFAPAITTINDDAMVIHFACVFATGTLTGWVPRAGFTLINDNIALTNAIGAADFLKTIAGAISGGLWNNTEIAGTEGDFLGMTFALKSNV